MFIISFHNIASVFMIITTTNSLFSLHTLIIIHPLNYSNVQEIQLKFIGARDITHSLRNLFIICWYICHYHYYPTSFNWRGYAKLIETRIFENEKIGGTTKTIGTNLYYLGTLLLTSLSINQNFHHLLESLDLQQQQKQINTKIHAHQSFITNCVFYKYCFCGSIAANHQHYHSLDCLDLCVFFIHTTHPHARSLCLH